MHRIRSCYDLLVSPWKDVTILSQTDGQTDGQMEAVASLPPFSLGPWAPPAERGPSLESIYWVSLTVDLCEGNK